jgi:hypothetical protein
MLSLLQPMPVDQENCERWIFAIRRQFLQLFTPASTHLH